jgi:DNA-binding NarL/FixJ family response regulator
MNSVRILLADDHELIRAGLAKILTAAHPEWEIVGEAANGAEAIEMGERLRPDVLIVDLSMPGGPSGLEVTEKLVESVHGLYVVVLTVHSLEPVMRQVRQAGANAFLAKNEAPGKLVSVLEKMLAGDRFFASESAREPLSGPQARQRVPVQYLLTPREMDVLRMLADGLTNKEIAAELDMSVRTVESHRANIMSRLAVDSLGELVRLAIRDDVV